MQETTKHADVDRGRNTDSDTGTAGGIGACADVKTDADAETLQ